MREIGRASEEEASEVPADIEDDQIRINTMAVEPFHADERFGMRARDRSGQCGAEQDRGAEATQRLTRAEVKGCFHDTGSWLAAIDFP